MVQTKRSIIEFCNNLAGHVANLEEYLKGVKKDAPMKKCFEEIKDDERFNAFKEVMVKTKGVTLKPGAVD